MKNNFTIFFSFTVFLYTFSSFTIRAQQNILSPISISFSQLDSVQSLRYSRVVAQNMHINYQLVQVQSLVSSQIDGKIAVAFTNSPCATTIFSAENVEYIGNDSNYYWYGNLLYEGSSSDCYKGYLMLIADSGNHFGQIQILNRTYDIFDLTGGIQLIAENNPVEAELGYCGNGHNFSRTTTEATPPIPTSSEEASFCNVRLLALYTPTADARDPNIMERISLSMRQTTQALLNSGIRPEKLKLTFAGASPVHYSESFYGSGLGGISKDIMQMTDSGDSHNIASHIRSLKNSYHADIVVMFVNATTNDGVRGTVYDIQDTLYPYAVVNKDWASNSSFTFAHEVGHIFGARHEDDGPDADTNYSIAHGHKFTYTSTTGFWPIKKTYINTQRTVPYADTKNNGEAVLHFSNPYVNYNGTPTGLASSPHGARNAARYLSNVGCKIAHYTQSEPANNFDVTAWGNNLACAGHSISLHATVFGPFGMHGVLSYTYEWCKSTDGIYYGAPVAFTQDYNLTMPYIPYLSKVFYRVKVTSPTGEVKYGFHSVIVIRMPTLCGSTLRQGLESEQSQITDEHADFSLSVYPTPAIDNVNIDFELQDDNDVSIVLYDITGRKVKQLFDGKTQKGKHAFVSSISELPNGIYLIKFSILESHSTQKISINH